MRFLRSEYSKHWGKTFYCYTCLHGFQAKKGEKTRNQCVLLQEHVKYCKTFKPQKTTFPKTGTITEFKNIHKMLMQPFVGYADVECTLKPVNEVENVATGIIPPEKKNTEENQSDKKSTKKSKSEKKLTEEQYQSHNPFSYFIKFVSIDPEFCLAEQENFECLQKETYVGEDAAEHFLDYVQQVANCIFEK